MGDKLMSEVIFEIQYACGPIGLGLKSILHDNPIDLTGFLRDSNIRSIDSLEFII